jgi:hypothetical protein
VSRATFGSLPLRSSSQHDLAAKSCPAHNFVIWSQILKLFHRNDHHIEMTCHAQHLGCYLEGQGHSMTLQQNPVRPITLLFEVGFYNYITEMITILRWSVAQHLGGYLEGQGHSMTLKQNSVQSITSLFEVGFYNYYTEIITILRQCVARNIWVVFTLRTLSVTLLWHTRGPKPILGASPGSTGSCLFYTVIFLQKRNRRQLNSRLSGV